MKELLDPDFMEKLDGLALLGRRRRGGRRGENLAWRRGTSLEFEDHRDYRPGDDVRYLDWNVWSRLHRLALKRFAAEEDMTVHLLLDASASMSFGSPTKFDLGVRVAASLGYIAWRRMDRVALAAFSERLGETLVPPRRRGGSAALFGALSRLETGGDTRFSESLTRYALRTDRPGLAVVISDLLDPEGYRRGLDALLYRRFDVLMIQILAPEDTDPRGRGELTLVDSENDRRRQVSFERSVIRRYRDLADRFVGEVETYCLKRGVEYLRTSCRVPFQDLVLRYLRGGSFLR